MKRSCAVAVGLLAPLALAAAAGTAAACPDHGAGASDACAAEPQAVCAADRVEAAMRRVAARAQYPGLALLAMRLNMGLAARCYPADLTDAELEALVREYQMLQPTQILEGLRFFSTTSVWTGDVSMGQSGRAQRARLTYSFVPDGANWDGQPNTLNATLTTNFGAGNEDRGKEYIRQALAAWRRFGGLTYQEVADNGTNRSSSTTRNANRGDIRIGGNARGTPNYLAYNYYPSAGGDMLINTSYFNPGSNMGNSSNNYRYLRNVVAHEHGHGLGAAHVVPCNSTKLMEPFIWTSNGPTGHDMLQFDEIRFAGRNYGDRYSGNSSAANAVDFGDLANPLRSVVERDLTTNGVAGPLNTDEDWFRFTLSSPQPVTIIVDPVGGLYINGQQDDNCNGTTATVNAENAGNLNIELRNSAGTTVLQSAASAGPGQIETLSAGTLPAGTYTIRVFDVGPNDSVNQYVQMYDLSVRVGPGGGAPAHPLAIAGVNKRVQANTNCYFMGHINSAATEPGAFIPTATGYQWDLDGDGVFEITSQQPVRQYVSNGVYPATLRVTDSNGRQSTDTITVTVFGATTTVTGVSPSTGAPGTTVPVVITGTNFKNVTSLSHMLVTGGGVTITGTPVSNFEGTEISGISFVIAPSAAPGPRNLNVTNSDGSGVGVGVFTVVAAEPECDADWDNDGDVDSSDISAFLSAWLLSLETGTLNADFNGDNSVNSTDISAFLASWLVAVQEGC